MGNNKLPNCLSIDDIVALTHALEYVTEMDPIVQLSNKTKWIYENTWENSYFMKNKIVLMW